MTILFKIKLHYHDRYGPAHPYSFTLPLNKEEGINTNWAGDQLLWVDKISKVEIGFWWWASYAIS